MVRNRVESLSYELWQYNRGVPVDKLKLILPQPPPGEGPAARGRITIFPVLPLPSGTMGSNPVSSCRKLPGPNAVNCTAG